LRGPLPTYRRTGSPLHAARPGIAIMFCAACCGPALVFDSPLVLVASLLAVAAAALAAGVGAELSRAARLGLPLALLIAAVNPLVSQQGLTVLFDGPIVPVLGNLDVTLEALVFGALAGLRVLVVISAFALYSACVDPDQVLRLVARVAPRSALTASLATRALPLLEHDAERLAEAYELRADVRRARGGRGNGRRASIRKAATLTRALAAGALERSIEVAAALEVRGYAGTRRLSGRRELWSRHDLAFALAALALVSTAVAGRLAALERFEPYPLLRLAAAPADLALAVLLPLLALAPFVAAGWKRRALRERLAHA
jgi:energy-coupling factor transport system permease protein